MGGLFRNNGKDNANYYIIGSSRVLGLGLWGLEVTGFRIYGFRFCTFRVYV